MAIATQGSVDVIIAAWNSAATIARAVDSALADPAVANVIVIDDASSDDTAARARAAGGAGERLIVHRLVSNGGPSRARNAALERSRAAWVGVLDADDYFDGPRISRLLCFAEDADMVADDIVQVQGLQPSAASAPVLSKEPFAPWRLDFDTFVARNITAARTARKELGFLKPIMRRGFLDASGLRYLEHLRLGEDFALYAAALARGARFTIVPVQGYVSVIREGSLSGRHSRDDLMRLRDNDYVLMRDERLSGTSRAIVAEHARSLDARVQWLEVIEAVKTRDVGRFIRPFLRSPQVSRFLVLRLWEQARLRSARHLGRSGAPPSGIA